MPYAPRVDMGTPAAHDEASPQPVSVDVTMRAYEQLRRAILDCTLRPGASVSQVQLAARLDVSRTPLREAIRLLQREGLVQSDFNKRVRVMGISIRDLEALTAMRLAVEPLGVRLTVPHLDRGDLENLRQTMERLHAAHDREPATVAHLHRSFHFGLVRHAEERLRTHIEDLWEQAERYRVLYQEADQTGGALIALAARAHERIFEAAEQRRHELCSRRVAEHIAQTAVILVARVDGTHEPTLVRESLRYVVDGTPADHESWPQSYPN